MACFSRFISAKISVMPNTGAGRPVVLNEERLGIAEQIVNSPGVVIAWTDDDMVDEINYRLKIQNKAKYMISQRSYERYKASFLGKTQEEIEDLSVGDMIVIEQFWRLIKAKLRMEKLTILAHFTTDPKRQRWAWMFERKFNKERAMPNQGNTAI